MVTMSHVKSFYHGLLVTCYECNGVKYVANQHGAWDVYEGAYERGGRTRTVPKDAEEIRSVIAEYKRQGAA
ncbi:MAG: hypothetical protein IT388_08890 [Nitrospirales bacterium]|nr:hypothetical protein [Nitrospirales bacterium]